MTHDVFYCSIFQFLYGFSPHCSTMTNIGLISALLSTLSKFKYFPLLPANFHPFLSLIWLQLVYEVYILLFSVYFSSCVFHIVSVENGEDVNLNCTNVSSFPSHVSWFKLTDQPNASKIASMKSSKSVATLYNGFQSGRFNMSSNSSTLILTIKEVGFSDSVLYFCGFVKDRYPVIQSATFLMVKGKIVLSLVCLLIGYKTCMCCQNYFKRKPFI